MNEKVSERQKSLHQKSREITLSKSSENYTLQIRILEKFLKT
jgi:hypothetical protein